MVNDISVDIILFETVEQIEAQLEAKKLHVLCVASTDSGSFCYKFLKNSVLSNSGNKIESTVTLINKNNDVACLYPSHYVSILPSLDYKNAQNLEALVGLVKELIFNAHEQLIKTNRLVFMLDSGVMDVELLSSALKQVLGEGSKPLKWLTNISIFHN
jgi:hypothetical protein